MAWVRRVRTASEATAVQIAESVDGRRRIVAHLGSAYTEAELGLLVERARALLDDPGQGELDLGIEPVAARTTLPGPSGEAALFGRAATTRSKRTTVAAAGGLDRLAGAVRRARRGVNWGSTRSATRCSGTW